MPNGILTLNSNQFLITTSTGTILSASSSSTPDRFFQVEQDDSSNSTVTPILRLTHTTSGTPAAGIGTSIELETETASGNTVGMELQSVCDQVTGGTETYHILLKTMKSGTLGNCLYIDQDQMFVYGGIIRLNSGSVPGSILFQSNILTLAGGSSGIILSDAGLNTQVTLDGSNNFGIGVAPTRRLDVLVDDGGNNTITYVGRFSHTTSGSAGAGIGTGLEFVAECASANKIGATIETVTTDVTNGSEDFDLVFRNMAAGAAAAETFRLSSIGEVLPKNVHNNGGNSQTVQAISSGTYTPQLSNTTNVAASTARACQWLRNGNVVNVSGSFDIDPTSASSNTVLGISLPIASTFTLATQLGGTAASTISPPTAVPYAILADTTNHRAQVQAVCGTNVANLTYYFSFQYVIV